MKRTRLSEEQIIAVFRQAERGSYNIWSHRRSCFPERLMSRNPFQSDTVN